MKFQEALSRLHKVAQALPDDDPDKQEMLDVEGDYSQLMEWALRKRNEFKAQSESMKQLADTYKLRSVKFEENAERIKDVIQMTMEAAGEKSYKGCATVSIRNVAPKPIIQDESKLPDAYKKQTITIDKAAINRDVKEGKAIDGVVLDNGGVSLTIRMK